MLIKTKTIIYNLKKKFIQIGLREKKLPYIKFEQNFGWIEFNVGECILCDNLTTSKSGNISYRVT